MTLTSPSTGRTGLVTLAIVIGLGAGSARADTTLRWKLKAGEVLRYQTVQTTVTTIQDLKGKPIQQTVALTIDLTWKVTSVDAEGRASIAETIDRMRTSAAMPYVGKLSDDSDDLKAADPAAPGPRTRPSRSARSGRSSSSSSGPSSPSRSARGARSAVSSCPRSWPPRSRLRTSRPPPRGNRDPRRE